MRSSKKLAKPDIRYFATCKEGALLMQLFTRILLKISSARWYNRPHEYNSKIGALSLKPISLFLFFLGDDRHVVIKQGTSFSSPTSCWCWQASTACEKGFGNSSDPVFTPLIPIRKTQREVPFHIAKAFFRKLVNFAKTHSLFRNDSPFTGIKNTADKRIDLHGIHQVSPL